MHKLVKRMKSFVVIKLVNDSINTAYTQHFLYTSVFYSYTIHSIFLAY